ncbi:MAG: hypothetical protein AB7I36_20630 [Rhodospirillaceae bacterium]
MTSLCIAEISDAEAESAGVRVGDLTWAEKITPLLIAKGFPREALFPGNLKIRTFRLPGNITQFELLS